MISSQDEPSQEHWTLQTEDLLSENLRLRAEIQELKAKLLQSTNEAEKWRLRSQTLEDEVSRLRVESKQDEPLPFGGHDLETREEDISGFAGLEGVPQECHRQVRSVPSTAPRPSNLRQVRQSELKETPVSLHVPVPDAPRGTLAVLRERSARSLSPCPPLSDRAFIECLRTESDELAARSQAQPLSPSMTPVIVQRPWPTKVRKAPDVRPLTIIHPGSDSLLESPKSTSPAGLMTNDEELATSLRATSSSSAIRPGQSSQASGTSFEWTAPPRFPSGPPTRALFRARSLPNARGVEVTGNMPGLFEAVDGFYKQLVQGTKCSIPDSAVFHDRSVEIDLSHEFPPERREAQVDPKEVLPRFLTPRIASSAAVPSEAAQRGFVHHL